MLNVMLCLVAVEENNTNNIAVVTNEPDILFIKLINFIRLQNKTHKNDNTTNFIQTTLIPLIQQGDWKNDDKTMLPVLENDNLLFEFEDYFFVVNDELSSETAAAAK